MANGKTEAAKRLHPETLALSYGYDPFLSEGAVKPPHIGATTFVFRTAAHGKKFFQQVLGKCPSDPSGDGLVYSRFNHPNLQMLEERLAQYERNGDNCAEACACFSSGMAALFTPLFAFLNHGDILLHSEPLYGGTDGMLKKLLAKKMGTTTIGVSHDDSYDVVMRKIHEHGRADRIQMILLETPANPTNTLFDIALYAKIARELLSHRKPEEKVRLVVDNTYLGPIFQHPLEHGADMVVYSLTKYVGGHSDAIAGACLGNKADIDVVKKVRGSVGDTLDPFTSWLLLRSLETLKVRMEQQTRNAIHIAKFLKEQKPLVHTVRHLSLLRPLAPQRKIYLHQCTGPGAMISFDVGTSEGEAYRFLDALKVVKLAVSLGSTESLAQHPTTMTHAGVDPKTRAAYGITDATVRLSVGIEHVKDLMDDLEQALKAV